MTKGLVVEVVLLGPLREVVFETAGKVGRRGDDDFVGRAPHSPAIEGTASGPLPMATRWEPQSSLLAKWRLRLSQS